MDTKKEITMKGKELKQLLENVDDEFELVGYQHGMEKSGILPISKYYMKTLQGERVERHTWDRFDGTDYTYEVFEEKKDGQMKLFRLY